MRKWPRYQVRIGLSLFAHFSCLSNARKVIVGEQRQLISRLLCHAKAVNAQSEWLCLPAIATSICFAFRSTSSSAGKLTLRQQTLFFSSLLFGIQQAGVLHYSHSLERNPAETQQFVSSPKPAAKTNDATQTTPKTTAICLLQL